MMEKMADFLEHHGKLELISSLDQDNGSALLGHLVFFGISLVKRFFSTDRVASC